MSNQGAIRQLFEIWGQDLSWSLLTVSVEDCYLKAFDLAIRTLRYKFQPEDSEAAEFVHQLRSVLVQSMVSPGWPSQFKQSKFEQQISVLANRLAAGYPEFSNLIKGISGKVSTLVGKETLLSRGLSHYLENSSDSKAVLSVRFSYGLEEAIQGLEIYGLDEFCEARLWQSICKERIGQTLILGGPLSWHFNALRIPPTNDIVVIQPSWVSLSKNSAEVFPMPLGGSLSLEHNRLGPTTSTDVSLIDTTPADLAPLPLPRESAVLQVYPGWDDSAYDVSLSVVIRRATDIVVILGYIQFLLRRQWL